MPKPQAKKRKFQEASEPEEKPDSYNLLLSSLKADPNLGSLVQTHEEQEEENEVGSEDEGNLELTDEQLEEFRREYGDDFEIVKRGGQAHEDEDEEDDESQEGSDDDDGEGEDDEDGEEEDGEDGEAEEEEGEGEEEDEDDEDEDDEKKEARARRKELDAMEELQEEKESDEEAASDSEEEAETHSADSDPFFGHYFGKIPADSAQAGSARGRPLKETECDWFSPSLVFSDNPAMPEKHASLVQGYKVKPKLIPYWAAKTVSDGQTKKKKTKKQRLAKQQAAAATDVAPQDCFTPLQHSLFSLMSSYRDVWYPELTPDNHQSVMEAYTLHILNHITKTRDLVLKNNAKISAGKEPDSLPFGRDQGFTRAKVLLLVPHRNAAYEFINMLLQMVPAKQKEQVLNHKRFKEEFSPPEEEAPSKTPKPADFQYRFRGNIDDCFRVGLSLTAKAVRLYAPFYASDIIVASPLGLRMIVGAQGDKAREYDFLSSIEMLVMDESETFSFQNWDHVTTVMEALNLNPKKSHDTDFFRVREWYLDGRARQYRQNLIFSDRLTPELVTLTNTSCSNYAGRVRVRPTYEGAICNVARVVRQIFQTVKTSSLQSSFDDRFNFFTKQVFPRLQATTSGHVLIFIESYFDFVRIRNFMKQKRASFCTCSEYDSGPDVTRSRGYFYRGERQFLLITERFHFYHRYRINGVRSLFFYSLPSSANFYPELLNMMDTEDSTCSVLVTRYDTLAMERVLGTERSHAVLQSGKQTHMFC